MTVRKFRRKTNEYFLDNMKRCSHGAQMRRGFGAPCVNGASSCILTCRRSASPRATGLGTGTAGAAGAPPSPVRPWSSSCSDSTGRDRYHGKPEPPLWGGGHPKSGSVSLCYSKRRLIKNTLIHFMVSSSISLLNRRKPTSLFFSPGTRLSAALLFSQPRQQVEDVHPSVRTGEAPLLLWQLESNWLVSLNTSILPGWAPHGRTDCKCLTKRWGLLTVF